MSEALSLRRSQPAEPAVRSWLGLLDRKPRWGLTWRGHFLLGLVAGLAAFGFARGAYSFLAITDRVDTKILVVEGWVHEYVIEAAVREFRAGQYQIIYTTGGPVVGTGRYTSDYNTSASVGADLLKKAGMAPALVRPVPSREMARERTYSAAVALRDYFERERIPAGAINVVTENVHARRTRMLFRRAFGAGAAVGVIGVPSVDFPSEDWWKYSDGVKDVITEGVAYLYARVAFLWAKPPPVPAPPQT